ncbi:MAG: hypothetical protein WCT10_03860 [Patescibacteria group bacterium]|jgi:predicted glycosyl hydrolase (DUF1957 family)
MASPIKVGLLLHFYQPWWQFPHVLSKIVDECYRPIFSWLDHQPRFALSANINWSLLELLRRHGHDDIIALMRRCVSEGKIELFGTAAHHPIMPLISETEAARQIERDHQGKNSVGLPQSSCGGFYLPEYAYSRDVVPPLRDAGYVYTIADDAAYAAQHASVPFDHVPRVGGLGIFLRSRQWGNALAHGQYDFDRLNKDFTRDIGRWFAGRLGYVVLATDAETFGHHHKKLIDWLLKPMVENWTGPRSPAEILPFERLWTMFGHGSPDSVVPPSSWSTEPRDFVTGNHFPLWKSPDNIYHQALWKLVDIARRFGAVAELDNDVQKALSSCCWWQVSGRPYFNPQLMMYGARKALEIIDRSADDKARQEGHKAFEHLVNLPGINR